MCRCSWSHMNSYNIVWKGSQREMVDHLSIPTPGTAIAFREDSSFLAVGSGMNASSPHFKHHSVQYWTTLDDGVVRIYNTPYTKVNYAIRNLGDSVSGLLFSTSKADTDIIIACGRTVRLLAVLHKDSDRTILRRFLLLTCQTTANSSWTEQIVSLSRQLGRTMMMF